MSMEDLIKRIEHLEEVAKKSGMESKAKLSIAFEYVEKEYGKELFEYAQDFATTMITYLNAYKISSTDLFSNNIETTETQDATKFLCKVLGYAPVVGEIFGYIAEVVDFIIEKVNKEQFKNKSENVMKVCNALTGWDPETFNRHICWGAIHLVIWYKDRLKGCSGKDHAAKIIGMFGACGNYIEKDKVAADSDYELNYSKKYLSVEDYPSFSLTLINYIWTLKKFKAVELNI